MDKTEYDELLDKLTKIVRERQVPLRAVTQGVIEAEVTVGNETTVLTNGRPYVERRVSPEEILSLTNRDDLPDGDSERERARLALLRDLDDARNETRY